eukprot:COSAG02_NODE_2856_length_7888_cov_6.880216_5_plen_166_part_00
MAAAGRLRPSEPLVGVFETMTAWRRSTVSIATQRGEVAGTTQERISQNCRATKCYGCTFFPSISCANRGSFLKHAQPYAQELSSSRDPQGPNDRRELDLGCTPIITSILLERQMQLPRYRHQLQPSLAAIRKSLKWGPMTYYDSTSVNSIQGHNHACSRRREVFI